jgi:hypothetical protein
MAQLIIRGEIDNLNFYNLTTGLSDLNPDSTYKISELYEVVTNLVESGELDALVSPQEIKMASLDNLEIELNQEYIDSSSLKLKNKDISSLIDLSENEEGELYLLRHYKGDGEFSYEIDDTTTEKDLSFEYLDCSQDFDQFDVLRESYLASFCDTIVANSLKIDDEPLDFEDFIFEPQLVRDELYIVKKDTITGINFLEKLEVGGNRLFGTDCDIDDLERN